MADHVFSSHNNFSAGELTPTIKGRTDLQLYQNGAETLINFLVLPSGGITRRPGTQYIHRFDEYRTRTFAELKFNTDLNFLVVFEVANREDKRLAIHVFFNDNRIDTLMIENILLEPDKFSFVSYQGKLYVCFGLDYPIYVLRPNDRYIVEQSEQLGRQLQQDEAIQTERKFIFEIHNCTVKYYTDEARDDFQNAQLSTQDQLREIANNKKAAINDYYDNLPYQITFKNQFNVTTLGSEAIYAGDEDEANHWPLQHFQDEDGAYFEVTEVVRKDFALGADFISGAFEWNVRLKTQYRVILKLEVIENEQIIETQQMPSLTNNNRYHNVSVKAFYVKPGQRIRLRLLNPHGQDQAVDDDDSSAGNQEPRDSNRCFIDQCQYKLSKTKKLAQDQAMTAKITYEYDADNFPQIPLVEVFETQKDIINVVAQTLSPQLFYFEKDDGSKQYYLSQTENQGNDYDTKVFSANKFVVTAVDTFTIAKAEALENNEEDEAEHPGTDAIKDTFRNELLATVDERLAQDLENYLYNEDIATRRLAVHDLISGIEADAVNDRLRDFDQIVEQDMIYCNAIALYNNRLWTFGTRDNIHAVYVSGMGDFSNFDMTYKNLLDVKNPLNPFYVVFNSATSDPVLWCLPFAGELLIGTTDGIYSVKEGKREHGEFIKVQKEIDIALAPIHPVMLAKSIFIVENGAQKIHNLSFSKEKGGFQLFDVTSYAEHLFARKIIRMTGLTAPFPMLFVQTGDRNFKILSFDYDLKLFGWSQHILGGQGAIHAMMAHDGYVYFYILRLPKKRQFNKGVYLEKIDLSRPPEKAPYVDGYSQFNAVGDNPETKHYHAIEEITTQLKNAIDTDFEENIRFDSNLFVNESWTREDFNDVNADYTGEFTAVKLNKKSTRELNAQAKASIHYFLRSYDQFGAKRVKCVVNLLVDFIKNLDDQYTNMVDYFYGFKQQFDLLEDIEQLTLAVNEYKRWIAFIETQPEVARILQLNMTITKDDQPQFYLNTSLFHGLANIERTVTELHNFASRSEQFCDHLQRQDTQNFFQKRQFAEMLMRLNKLFVLNILNPKLKYGDVLRNIYFYTHLEFDVLAQLQADNAEDLEQKMREKMQFWLEKDKNQVLTNTLLKQIMVRAFKRIAVINGINEYNEDDLFNDINFVQSRPNEAEPINDEPAENQPAEDNNRPHDIEAVEPDAHLLDDAIEIEADEEVQDLIPYLQTYRFADGANIQYEQAPGRHDRIQALEAWFTEAIFKFSGMRETVNNLLSCLYADQHKIEDISAYRLKLTKLFNNTAKHHEFLQYVRGLSAEELTAIVTGDLRQAALNQENITAFKERYTDGGAFCVSNHGTVQLHAIAQAQKHLKAVAQIHVGYPYRSVMQSLPFIQDEQVEFIPAQKTTFHVLLRNSKDVTIHTKDLLNHKVIIGITSDMPHPDDERWVNGVTNLYLQAFMDSLATPLRSGWHKLEIEGGINHETTVTVVCDRPYPATILKVAAKAKLLQEYR